MFFGIDSCNYIIIPFTQQGQYRVIDIIIQQDNRAFGTPDNIRNKCIGIKNLPVVENTFFAVELVAFQSLKKALQIFGQLPVV